MKSKYEFVKFPNDFPIRIALKKVTKEEKDWHTLIKIIYALEGCAKITFNDTSYSIKPDDVILINPWTIYEIEAKDSFVYIDFEINLNKFGIKDIEGENFYFDCNSTKEDSNKFNYKIIKSCILSLIKINVKSTTNLKYINISLAYQVIYVLLEQFKVESTNNIQNKHFKVLKSIINYIEANYDKDLSLNDIAYKFGYTPQYFSSFFSKHMHQTFKSYYDTLRINSHFYMLESGDLALEEIALKSGFTDYRSYIRAFKSIYNVTPSEYRKSKDKNEINTTDLEFDREKYLDMIFNHNINNIENDSKTRDTRFDIDIDFLKKTKLIEKTFLNMTSIGKASDLLRKNVQEVVEEAKSEIGFNYLRFHGIFSDDMHVFRRFRNGTKSYSFVYIDEILDYLRSIHLRPFLELSFMPRDLAKDKNKILFESKFLTSEPEHIEEWNDLLREFFHHIIDKYTLAEVIKWPISLWCEPDSTSFAYGFDDEETFFKFYEATYKTIKSISSRFKIGSPGLIPFASWAPDWDKRFFSFTESHDCYPDFLCVHYYANDFDFFLTGRKIEKISKDPDNLKNYIKKIKDPKFYHGNEIYLTQWNLTSSHRNYLNDTIYASCYLTKNILENMDELRSFTRWTLTDFMDETQLTNKAFHGGLGLYTYNGIPKAPFNALKFLSRISNNLLANGNGYYVTKTNEGIQIILYNYEHYSDLYADGEYFTLKEHSRYEPFLMDHINHHNFSFTNIPYDYAHIKVSRITRESGSSYDIYDNMSHLELENLNDIKTLCNLSTPKYDLFKKEIMDGRLDVEISTNSLEVKLIEIKFFKEKKR